jgi:hypothetical protein
MKRIDPQDVGRAVLNRDRMVYLTMRELMDGGYLDCKEEVCRMTEKGKEAYTTAAKEWEKVR